MNGSRTSPDGERDEAGSSGRRTGSATGTVEVEVEVARWRGWNSWNSGFTMGKDRRKEEKKWIRRETGGGWRWCEMYRVHFFAYRE